MGSCPDVFTDLPSLVEERIVSFLPPNDLAYGYRFVNKAACFRHEDKNTIRLSEPVSESAFRAHFSVSALRKMTLAQRQLVLLYAARTGNISLLAYALQHAGCALTGAVMEIAAAAGHLAACQWLRRRGCPLGKALEAACRGGHLEVCRWARQQGCPWKCALMAAAGKGHRHVCEWVLSSAGVLVNRVVEFAVAIEAAGRGGHMGLIDWLLLQGPRNDWWVDEALCGTAFSCDLGALQRAYRRFHGEQAPLGERYPNPTQAAIQSPMSDWREKADWLVSRGFPALGRGSEHIAVSGLPAAAERLRWLVQHGYAPSALDILAAVKASCTASLEYLLGEMRLRAAKKQLAVQVAEVAAHKGHLPTVKLLLTHGVVTPDVLILAAAAHGQLALLAWAEQRFPRVVRHKTILLLCAAQSGNLKMLEWLHKRGFRVRFWMWHSYLEAAVGAGCEAALEWLVVHGAVGPATGKLYIAAAHNGDLATLRCLRRLGCCPWGPPSTFTKCVSSEAGSAPLPALRCLVEEGCPVDWEAASQAVQARRTEPDDREEVARWLGSARAERQERQEQPGKQRGRLTRAAQAAGLRRRPTPQAPAPAPVLLAPVAHWLGHPYSVLVLLIVWLAVMVALSVCMGLMMIGKLKGPLWVPGCTIAVLVNIVGILWVAW